MRCTSCIWYDQIVLALEVAFKPMLQSLWLRHYKVWSSGRTFGKITWRLHWDFAEIMICFLQIGLLVARRQIAREIVILLERSVWNCTLSVSWWWSDILCRNVWWHLVGMANRVVERRKGHVLLATFPVIFKLVMDKFEFTWDDCRTLIMRQPEFTFKAL